MANGSTPETAGPQGGLQKIMLLTSDVALMHDKSYSKIVRAWADDTTSPSGQELFDHSWKHAWYKLTTRDMGPVTRCLEAKGSGFHVPSAEPWQHPLPPQPDSSDLANFSQVADAIRDVMLSKHVGKIPKSPQPDSLPDGNVSHGASFIKLAYHCAATFRSTDYQGGCNGARIRFPPQSEWPANEGLDATLRLLAPIKERADKGGFGGVLSWADLIVLAGNTALENAGVSVNFCGGRTDDPDGSDTSASSVLEPTQLGPDPPGKLAYPAVPTQIMYLARRLGLSTRQLVALMGGLHTLGTISNGVNDPTMIPSAKGVTKPPSSVWTTTPGEFSNEYFKNLLELSWECASWPDDGGKAEKSNHYWNCNHFEPVSNDSKPSPIHVGKYTLAMLPTDLAVKNTPQLASMASEFLGPNGESNLFRMEFASTWEKLMNNDRFDGPTGNICQ